MHTKTKAAAPRGRRRERGSKAGFGFLLLLFLAAFAVSAFCVVTGAYVQDGYVLRVGMTSPKRFRAPREVENTIATEKLRTAAANAVPMQYKINPDIKPETMERLEAFFTEISVLRAEYMPLYDPNEPQAQGIDLSAVDRTKLSVFVTPEQLVLLVTEDSETYGAFRDAVTQATEYTMDTGVRQDTMNVSILAARDELNQNDWSAAKKTLAAAILTAVVEANNLPDPEGTDELRGKEMAKVAPVMFIQGQNIVDEGDIITTEVYYVLDELGYVNNGFWENLLPTAGAVLLAGLLLGAGLLYLVMFQDKLLIRRKEALLLFVLYAACVALARLMSGLPQFFLPILLFTMLIGMLLETRLAVVMNVIMTVVCAVICYGDMKFVIFFLLTGTLAAILAKFVAERSRAFTIGIVLSGLSAFAVAAVYLLFDKGYTPALLTAVVYSVLAGLLSVMLCIGTLPFWESVFGVVTPIKLLDLTNPNSPLLRRLITETPGTYHHSIIVANLAETAAFDIGANHILARIGGYYHDIGKMKYPQYFAENQMGENPHDDMPAYESVAVIMEHVDNGRAMAQAYRLPRQVRDMIVQHHGTCMIKYFYVKAQKENPAEAVNEADFRYNGEIPQFRESAVVMLADTVEAAVRSIIPQGKTMAETEAFVRMLIKDKLDDGQLEDSGLTIKDLDTIAKAFMRVFKGMYHERIPYPKGSTKELKAAAAKAEAAPEEKEGETAPETSDAAPETDADGIAPEADTDETAPEADEGEAVGDAGEPSGDAHLEEK